MEASRDERHVRQTIGFRVSEAEREQKGLLFLVQAVLQELCEASLEDILCLQDRPAQGIYDVTFHEEPVCTGVLERLKAAADAEVLHGIEFTQGRVSREVPLTVQVFDLFCSYDAVVAFLQIYCDYVGKGVKLCDELPLWNGRRRFIVTLEADDAGIGGTLHPPAVFTIGSCPCYLYYPGQPKFCSTCSKFGHFRSDCVQGQVEELSEDALFELVYPTLSMVEDEWRLYDEELAHKDVEFISGQE